MLKKLSIIASIFFVASTLAGCAAFEAVSGSYATPQQIQTADSGINVAVASATTYQELPLCGAPTTTSVVCRTDAASAQLNKDVIAVVIARRNMKKLLRANGGGNVPIADYNTFKAAVDTIQSDVALYATK